MIPKPLTLHAELTLFAGETLLANAKRIELLRQIDATENLTKAAKIAGFSYKSAWDAIDLMARLSGGTLLERVTGGKGGGRTYLTVRGKQMLKNFVLIQDEHARFIARLNTLANGLAADYALLSETPMKTSARNQYPGMITAILQGPVNDLITIRIDETVELSASITHRSCKELQLDIGAKVFALIKASTLDISLQSEGKRGPEKNTLAGTIRQISLGEEKTEIIILLGSGLDLVATIPNSQVKALGLQSGLKVQALVDASNVLIGVAA